MKITMYELLKMNKNDLPNKIKFNEKIWRLASNKSYFIGSDYGYDFWIEHGDDKLEDEVLTLNDTVEILEEQKKETKPLEEKKIPEKLPYYSMEKIQKAKNKDEWREERITLLEKRVNDLHIKMNDLLDYLKSKGE